jgi:hypothetical protein
MSASALPSAAARPVYRRLLLLYGIATLVGLTVLAIAGASADVISGLTVTAVFASGLEAQRRAERRASTVTPNVR